MFDRKRAIITYHAQIADHITPYVRAVTVTDGPEDPTALGNVAIRSHVQHAIQAGIEGVNLGVLGMEMIDGITQRADGRGQIYTLPKRWLGSKLTPIVGPIAWRRRSIVPGL